MAMIKKTNLAGVTVLKSMKDLIRHVSSEVSKHHNSFIQTAKSTGVKHVGNRR